MLPQALLYRAKFTMLLEQSQFRYKLGKEIY